MATSADLCSPVLKSNDHNTMRDFVYLSVDESPEPYLFASVLVRRIQEFKGSTLSSPNSKIVSSAPSSEAG